MSNNVLENFIDNKIICTNNYFEYRSIVILCKKFIPYSTSSINIENSVFKKNFEYCYNYNELTNNLDYPVYLHYYNSGLAGPFRKKDTKYYDVEIITTLSLFEFIKNRFIYL